MRRARWVAGQRRRADGRAELERVEHVELLDGTRITYAAPVATTSVKWTDGPVLTEGVWRGGPDSGCSNPYWHEHGAACVLGGSWFLPPVGDEPPDQEGRDQNL